jgi:ATP-dependent DNA helicase DinG
VLVDRSQLSVEDVFALISERFDVYEHRPQQLELAHAINRTFTKKETGIFEAGTGTGKSLAALIPAILSGKRVVVSSATISLQEQYINKDIPSLQALLPFDFKAVLLKGRGNYLGLRRYQDHVLEEEIDSRLVDWMHTTETGDMSELDFMPPLDAWYEINSDGDDCLRNKCPRFNDCFYFEARRKAEKADIIVVNHALLLADAASNGNILPQYDYLIVDEAHHLPEIARDAFSASISNRGLRRLVSRAYKKVSAPPQLVHDVEVEGDQFFYRLSMEIPSLKARMRNAVQYGDGFRESLGNLKKWLEEQEFEELLDVDMARDKAKLKAKALMTTVNNYVHCLDLLEKPDKDWVVWAERGDVTGSRFEVIAAPLQVAPFLQSLLIDKQGLEASVWMSATLATGGEDPFAFFKKSIGTTEHVIQNRIASPFDYKHQALLYLPNTLPEPNDRNYVNAAADEIERIVRFSNGRAFVLFTSYSAMNAAFDLLKDRLPFDCQKQGDMPRKRLIEWFLSTYNSVLFGTSSFWEGVSVDGDQLSCVIIDRIPFQVPDDPVYEAQCEAIKESGEGSWFNDLALPYAIMRLKQGVGRLIRTRSDRGMVAILDPRLTRKQYGRLILECLPPFRLVRKLVGESIDEML